MLGPDIWELFSNPNNSVILLCLPAAIPAEVRLPGSCTPQPAQPRGVHGGAEVGAFCLTPAFCSAAPGGALCRSGLACCQSQTHERSFGGAPLAGSLTALRYLPFMACCPRCNNICSEAEDLAGWKSSEGLGLAVPGVTSRMLSCQRGAKLAGQSPARNPGRCCFKIQGADISLPLQGFPTGEPPPTQRGPGRPHAAADGPPAVWHGRWGELGPPRRAAAPALGTAR